MAENAAETWAYGLVRYDLTTYLPEAVLGMPHLCVRSRLELDDAALGTGWTAAAVVR